MADKKISALTASSTPLAGTEVLPIVQSSATVKVAVSDLTAGRAVSAASLSTTGSVSIAGLGTGAKLDIGSGTLVQSAAIISTRTDGINALLFSDNHAGTTKYGAVGVNNAADSWGLGYTASAGTLFTSALTWIGTGNVTVSTGDLVIGTSGKGIDFSVTSQAAGMTSELLADYEEGTWTPALLFDSGMTGSFTYTTQTGTYTKVGRLVTARFNLAWTARPSAGLILLVNLPFTAVNAANVQGFISAQGGITDTGYSTIVAGDGLTVSAYTSTQGAICAVKSGGAYTDPLQQSALTSASGTLAGVIIYEVT